MHRNEIDQCSDLKYKLNRAYAEVTKIAEPYLVGKASASRTQIPDGRF
jgi:hypothetical protein